MKLYRYSLRKNDQENVKESDFIVRFPRGNVDVSLKATLFTTPFLSYDSDMLNQKLSITYYPRWVATVEDGTTELEANDNQFNPLKLDSNYNDIPRTWPAFGKTGGVPEVLIISPVQIRLSNHYEIIQGGAVERYHQDDVENYELPVAVGMLISGVLFREELGPLRNEGMPEGREEGHIGIVRSGNIAISASVEGGNLTLSAGYEIIGYRLILKIWGALWDEDRAKGIRHILYDSTDAIEIFPCFHLNDFQNFIRKCYGSNCDKESIKKEYTEILKIKTSYPSRIIMDNLASLIGRLKKIKIDSGYFMLHSQKVALV
ncbi:MAG: hypothetical protein QXV17_14480 [Candidatus Micrarchaeaceae archaeon]